MITESDARTYKNRTTIVWSLCASLLVNLVAWMLALWIAGLNINLVAPKHEPPELIVSSSSVTISHRMQPQPQRRSLRPVPQQQPQPKQPKQPQPKQPQPKQAVLAQRPVAQEPAKTLAQQLAEQEQAFTRTAQELKSENQNLSDATPAPIAPSTYHRTYMDLNGRDPRERIEALLEPLGPDSHWIANGQSCYYVHYYAQYSGGGNEQGNIPWPVCYPANHDAMLPLNRVHDLPIPSPPLGYVLPPGTTLGPLLMRIYSGTIHS
jgi:hypothetical protein